MNRHVDSVWRSPDGSRVFTAVVHGSDQPTRFDVHTYDAATQHEIGRPVSLRGYAIRSASITAHDVRLVVTIDAPKA